MMTTRHTKTTLLVLVSLTLLFVLDLKDSHASDDLTMEDFKREVREWLENTPDDQQAYEEKISELKLKYNVLLLGTVEKARIQSSTPDLTEYEILGMINYIVTETIKDEKIKILNKDSKSTSYATISETPSIVIHDGNPIIFSKGDVLSYVYPNVGDDSDGKFYVTFESPVNGFLMMHIPKSLPILSATNVDEYVFGVYALINDELWTVDTLESNCYVSYPVTVYNSTRIDIFYEHILTIIPEWTQGNAEPHCHDLYEKLRQVQDFNACPDSHIAQWNVRAEQVCINQNSIPELIMRGYLI